MRVRWTPEAAEDLEHICDYILRQRQPDFALSVARTIYEGVAGLARHPYNVCSVLTYPFTETRRKLMMVRPVVGLPK